jgi:ATP diphosphatase
MTSSAYTIEDLLRIMQRLRDPDDGCPWDVAQSFQSIVPSTLEECYELAHAIESEDYAHVAEELGDVLFQVIFYAQLGTEKGLFSFEQVVSILSAKLLRRHPHVFAQGEIEGRVSHGTDVEEVNKNWESIKRFERQKKSLHGILDDVPRALPALPRAQKIQKRAATVNFDWPDYQGARAKIQEELLELDEAVRSKSLDSIEDEMGDLLFSCVNASRHLGLDAEASLRRATLKFEGRFQEMVRLAELDSRSLNEFGNEELEVLWGRAKDSAPDTQSSEKP